PRLDNDPLLPCEGDELLVQLLEMLSHPLFELRVQRQFAAQDEVPTDQLVVKKRVMTGTVFRWSADCEAVRSAREFREKRGRRVEKSAYLRVGFFGWLAPLLVPLSPSMCHQEADENPDGQTGDQADDPDGLRARPHLTPPCRTAVYSSAVETASAGELAPPATATPNALLSRTLRISSRLTRVGGRGPFYRPSSRGRGLTFVVTSAAACSAKIAAK